VVPTGVNTAGAESNSPTVRPALPSTGPSRCAVAEVTASARNASPVGVANNGRISSPGNRITMLGSVARARNSTVAPDSRAENPKTPPGPMVSIGASVREVPSGCVITTRPVRTTHTVSASAETSIRGGSTTNAPLPYSRSTAAAAISARTAGGAP